MSKAKHTQGKWHEYDGDIVSESDIKGDIVCSAPLGFPKSMKRWEANARLIAEAPSMYEILKTINKGIHKMEFSQLEGLQNEIEGLIKKIEG